MNDRLQMAGGDCIGLCDYTILEPVAAFDDANTRVRYSGEWTHQLAGSSYAGTTTWSKTPGASATLRFRGRRVWWVAPFGRPRGSATVYLDGKAVAVVHLHHTAALDPSSQRPSP
jgi:hypothetical protein